MTELRITYNCIYSGVGNEELDKYKQLMMKDVSTGDMTQQAEIQRAQQDTANISCIRVHSVESCSVECYPLDSEVFTQGADSPCLHLSGVPLAVIRGPPTSGTSPNNQLATYFMADPLTGLAPPEWQQGVGSVLLVRRDRKHIFEHDVDALWDYLNVLMERFADSGGREVPPPIHHAVFQQWLRQYNEDQNEMARCGMGGSSLQVFF
jgi:hypothetical protein